MIPERPPFDPGDRFRDASRAYFAYGVVYWIGGAWLALHGVGVRGSMETAGMTWIILGLVFVLAIPYLLRRPRPWFEHWVLSRRDFARILTVLMARPRVVRAARGAAAGDGVGRRAVGRRDPVPRRRRCVLPRHRRRAALRRRRRMERRPEGDRVTPVPKRYKGTSPATAGSNIEQQVSEQHARLHARLAAVRAIVAWVSGKGGVGKSSLTANLAACWALEGGAWVSSTPTSTAPPWPRMLGVRGRRLVVGAEGVTPPEGALGVRVMSMGPAAAVRRRAARLGGAHAGGVA